MHFPDCRTGVSPNLILTLTEDVDVDLVFDLELDLELDLDLDLVFDLGLDLSKEYASRVKKSENSLRMVCCAHVRKVIHIISRVIHIRVIAVRRVMYNKIQR